MSTNAIDLGSRRELLVDEALVAEMEGAVALQLQRPIRREAALVTDRHWEGNMCGFVTVLAAPEGFRMYYKGWDWDLKLDAEPGGGEPSETHIMNVCCALSQDGRTWRRPSLGLVESMGYTENNIVWQGEGPKQHGSHGFAPFIDANPAVPTEERWKAVGADRRATQGGLYGVVSPDGYHWHLLDDDPILTDARFDSQNLAFWDAERGEYRAYMRKGGPAGRDIATATSPDFREWTAPALLSYPGAPGEELYTNQIMPYPRAPHIYVGFPTRYVERPWSPMIERLPELGHRHLRSSLSERYGTALTDGLFMSSRNGREFKRWGEAFVRPGLQPEGNWAYGDNYQCWGMLETESDIPGVPELSFYTTEDYWRGNSTVFRRYTLRMDGFVSLNAGRDGGMITTKPLRFSGTRLELNMSSSAAGSLRIAVLDAEGREIPGFGLDDCEAIIGDELARTVHWQTSGSDLSTLRDKPVRLRIELTDADLYSYRFAD